MFGAKLYARYAYSRVNVFGSTNDREHAIDLFDGAIQFIAPKAFTWSDNNIGWFTL